MDRRRPQRRAGSRIAAPVAAGRSTWQSDRLARLAGARVGARESSSGGCFPGSPCASVPASSCSSRPRASPALWAPLAGAALFARPCSRVPEQAARFWRSASGSRWSSRVLPPAFFARAASRRRCWLASSIATDDGLHRERSRTGRTGKRLLVRVARPARCRRRRPPASGPRDRPQWRRLRGRAIHQRAKPAFCRRPSRHGPAATISRRDAYYRGIGAVGSVLGRVTTLDPPAAAPAGGSASRLPSTRRGML